MLPAAAEEKPAAEPEAVSVAPKAAAPARQESRGPAAEERGRPRRAAGGDDTETREERRPGRSYDRDDSESRPRRPGGGGRGRYRTFYRRKYCKFCSKKTEVSYRDVDTLRRFITDRGKILPRRITGTCPKHQRQLSVAIKQARILALLPFVEK